MAEPTEANRAYRSLNAIQSFRIVARDATVTKGCRLHTNPIPKGFGEVVEVLKDLAVSLKRDGKVADNGFFTDEDHQFQSSEFDKSNLVSGISDTSQQESSTVKDSW